jgi:hypothetical protein
MCHAADLARDGNQFHLSILWSVMFWRGEVPTKLRLSEQITDTGVSLFNPHISNPHISRRRFRPDEGSCSSGYTIPDPWAVGV